MLAPMQRVVVLGGSGYLGSRAVRALQKAGTVDVQIASRRSPLKIDLADPSTFDALRGTDIVLDLADTTTHRPDSVARFCRDNGIVFVEGSSDPGAVQRLGADVGKDRDAKGAIVLGAGVFTGVSNLLARSVGEKVGGAPRALTLGISTSPFSGSGSGTVELMVAMLRRNAVRWIGGTRHEEPLGRGPRVTFPSGARPTLRAAFPEQDMIGPSTRATSSDVLFAPVPGLLVMGFLILPRWLLPTRALAWVMRVYFTLLRRVLLRGMATRLEMVADAEGADGTKAHAAITTGDGMQAGGAAAAAIVLALLARAERPHGTCFVDDVLQLDDVIARANALAGERAKLVQSSNG
jgi:hypothetical protein